jgi:MtN3 and saliva related transmembrane protein
MASFVPQLAKIIRDRDASAISTPMYVVTVTGFALWAAYGLGLKSWPLVASNSVSLALSAAVLGLKLFYSRRGDAGRNSPSQTRNSGRRGDDATAAHDAR